MTLQSAAVNIISLFLILVFSTSSLAPTFIPLPFTTLSLQRAVPDTRCCQVKPGCGLGSTCGPRAPPKGPDLTFDSTPTLLPEAAHDVDTELRGAGCLPQLTRWHLVPPGDNWSAVLLMPGPRAFSTWPLSLVRHCTLCVSFETRKPYVEMVFCQMQVPNVFLI